MISTRYSKVVPLAFIALCLWGCGKREEKSPRASGHTADPNSLEIVYPSGETAPSMPAFRAPRLFKSGTVVKASDSTSSNYVREWNWFTTVNDYRNYGRTNPAWDAAAVEAMERYCDVRAVTNREEQKDLVARLTGSAGAAAAKAMAAHCDDPLVEYIHIRYVLSQRTNMTDEAVGKLYANCADRFEKTDYSPVRKMYANLRAAIAMAEIAPKGTNVPPKLTGLRRTTVGHLNEMLHDPNLPPSEAAECTRQVYDSVHLSTVGRFDFEKVLMPTLQTLWTNQAFSHEILGEYYINKAWRIRGGGYANTVDEKKWEGFAENLENARSALEHAWALDQTDVIVPVKMITVCMGLSLPRETMEVWFDRAMAIDPNCYAAVSGKEYYLEPKWLGSRDELIAFGRECVASEKWGGNVPLILQVIHHSLQKYENAPEDKYFSRAEVWRDVSRSYERFFELNPTDVGWRHNYALDAYRAQHYDVFLQQLPKFTTGTNYQFFGGKRKYDEMVRTAIERTK